MDVLSTKGNFYSANYLVNGVGQTVVDPTWGQNYSATSDSSNVVVCSSFYKIFSEPSFYN